MKTGGFAEGMALNLFVSKIPLQMNLFLVTLLLLIAFKLFSVLRRYLTTTPRQMSQQTISQVEELIKSKPVFVASKTYCPYCSATKRLINEVYPEAYILELDTMEEGSEVQDALTKITGQRTVPNIFINGKHIGGNSDLQALGKEKIKKLINESQS